MSVLNRQRHVVDMMLSMHSMLRVRYRVRATLLDISLMSVSTLLCALTFASDRVLRVSGFSTESGTVWIGLLSVSTFALSLVGMRVNWKEQAAKHDRACQTLAQLKGRLRGAEHPVDDGILSAELADLVPVPERLFNSLKANHLRKVAISRVLSDAPTCPIWLIRIRLLLRDSRKLWSNQEAGDGD